MSSIVGFVLAVKNELTPDGIGVELGWEFQDENNAPPRVLFVPAPDRYIAGRQTANLHIPRNYLSIGTRSVGLQVRIWGAAEDGADQTLYPDIAATELLLDRTIVAIRKVSQGSYVIEGGDWMPGGRNQLGRLYMLQLRIELPVLQVVGIAGGVGQTYGTFTDVSHMKMAVLNTERDPAP